MKHSICVALACMLASASLFAGSITVIQPNGGEEATLGGKLAVRWSAVDVSQNVRINLVRGSEVVGTIASNLPSGNGYFLWDVGQLADGTAPAGGNYFIRVRVIDSSEVDQSDGPFSIAPTPLPKGKLPASLRVEQPNGGENWRLGSEQTIRWSSRFLKGKVHLQLYRHNGAGVGTIADNLPASGSYAWKAGEILSSMTVAGQYKIRAVAMDNHTVNDMSDGPFELQPRLADVVGPVDPELLGKPDLVICAESDMYTALEVPAQIHIGVKNIGKKTAKAGFSFCYNNGGEDTNPIVIPVDLPPGGGYSPLYITPNFHVAGTTLYTFKVDPGNQVAEANEGNNQLQTRFTVTTGQVPADGPYACSGE